MPTVLFVSFRVGAVILALCSQIEKCNGGGIGGIPTGLNNFGFLVGIFQHIHPAYCGPHRSFFQIECPCPWEMSFCVLWG